MDADAAYFVSKAAKFEVVDGMFHISFDVGRKAHFEIVMAPAIFAKTHLFAEEILAKWHAEHIDTVVALPKRRR